jgi:D-alanyl-D-alanine-carboxypeptidase/D-alanyl-D-alanine-endopeptidase
MKTKTLIAFIGAVLMALPIRAKPPVDMQAKLDAWTKGESGGLSAAWVDADGIVYFHAGKFDEGDSRPITADTKFEIGSISKVFTSLLLFESERLGKVSRNDPAAKYLIPKDDPSQASLSKITLISLSTHTSGLPRMPFNFGVNGGSGPNPYAAYGRDMLVAALKFHGPTAVVGGSVSYSNFGAAVLGEALASAWGMTYTQALHARVLDPLGLTETSVGLADTDAPVDLAPGHLGAMRVPNWTFQAFAPAGAIRSSARDMATFVRDAMGADSPLKAAFEATELPLHPLGGGGGHVGMAWMIRDNPDNPIIWHNGATAGSHAVIAFTKKSGSGVVLLANIQKESESLSAGLLGVKIPVHSIPKIENASEYVGSYPLSPAFVLTVTQNDGSLYVQATGQPRLDLARKSDDTFKILGVDASISFERDQTGKIIALVLHQNGMDQRALLGRMPSTPPEVSLPAEVLKEYVGDYALSPTFVITIDQTGGALFAHATGQASAPIFASAKDEFFYRVVNAQISFKRDASGVVTQLVLHQAGHDLPAPKNR